MLSKDFQDIVNLLSSHDVRFVIVGAYALGVYGYTRSTGDLDIFIKPELKNAKKMMLALTEFGAPMASISEKDLTLPGTVFQIGIAPMRIDILTSIDGVTFEEIQPERLDLGGVTAPVIDYIHLLKNKRSTGRLRDLADAEELEKRSQET